MCFEVPAKGSFLWGSDKKKNWNALLWYKCRHTSLSPPEMPHIQKQIILVKNVSNSFSKPGPNFPLQFQWKPISIYKWRNIVLTILGCVMQLCVLSKKLLCLFLLSFLFKDNTTLGIAEETSEKQSPFHTRNMWTLSFEMELQKQLAESVVWHFVS